MSNASPAIQGTVNINYIVASILNRLRDYSTRHWTYLAQLVIEGMTELSIWHLDTIEVVYLRMSEAKIVNLPADYVDYTKIGFPLNGKLRVITNDNRALLPRTFADGEAVGNSDEGTNTEGIYFVDHFRNGQFVGGMYGLPGGTDELYYRIDRENRQIIFSGSSARTDIVLEYVSSGIKLSGQTSIPREAVPSLRAYVMWVMAEPDARIAMGEKERRKNNYLEEVEALRYFQSAFTADEYRAMIRSHTHQTIKR